MRSEKYFALCIAAGAALAACALTAGCNAAAHRRVTTGATPTLISDDAPLHGRGGTNPNAPYVVLDRRPTLVTRSIPDASGGAPDCNAGDLDVAEVGADANGSDRIVKLSFVNIGANACRLGGYPEIALLNDKGRPVGSLDVVRSSATSLTAVTAPAAAAASETTPAAVLLPAHGEAYFQVGWTTGEGCPTVSEIVISAPNTTKSFLISHPLVVCSGKIRVTSVHPNEQGMSS
jgi:hypothetical protein